ncbi:unnamed protein product [Phytophthora fragariaefolia]|uniref:Unnamed protein product n=1 Tax=Phytophthora fragariaefolia TaxID=1490495 RepID=A0A9W6XKS8_9STRA|nr:unnamed protein product [Phytophthora fragariaefolia]
MPEKQIFYQAPSDVAPRLVLPNIPEVVDALLYEFHVAKCYGHPGVERTLRHVDEYHVKWLGQPKRTWEPDENLQYVRDSINRYHNRHNNQKNKRKTETQQLQLTETDLILWEAMSRVQYQRLISKDKVKDLLITATSNANGSNPWQMPHSKFPWI